MNIHNPELLRQHNDAKAIRARLWGKADAPKEIPVVIEAPKRQLVQLDYHVWLYRLHRFYFPANLSTSSSFQVRQSDEFHPYQATVEFEGAAPRPMMRDIAMEVLKAHKGVTFEDLKGNKRTRAIVMPRQIAMYEIARQRPDKSYPEIGRFFGGKDHTSVLHAVRKMRALYERDADSEAWMARRERGNRESHERSKQKNGSEL